MRQGKRYHCTREEHIQKSAREGEGVSEESEEGVCARYPGLIQLLLGFHQHQDHVLQLDVG